MTDSPLISVSVVSHSQAALVDDLLRGLATRVKTPVEIILTVNIPEPRTFDPNHAALPVRVRVNREPKGFGANHNAAFRESRGKYFCVLNPDIRIEADPFPALLACLADPRVGVAAPLIRNPAGAVEDSVRRFPTPWTILAKALLGASPDYAIGKEPMYPEWVAGMFMLFPHEVFEKIGGFDERYFLYYEDVDLCARLAIAGLRIAVCPAAYAVHTAQRESRRNLRYLRWHLGSMLRFFLCHPRARSRQRKVMKAGSRVD
jgi:N-acetylglucosaminyl-diphospho-decaprenol L-rhamnosyltransferase